MPTVYVPDAVITLKAETCCSCGVTFAMPADLMRNRREDQRQFYCPNGHGQSYIESEAYKLRQQLAAKEREVLAAKSRAETEERWRRDAEQERARAERSVRGHKAVVTRMKKRVAAGSCPCCSKKFKNLEEHMKAEHPKWDPDRAAAELAAKES